MRSGYFTVRIRLPGNPPNELLQLTSLRNVLSDEEPGTVDDPSDE